MERVIRVFASHQQADDADRKVLAEMSPQERLDWTVALHAQYRESYGDAGQVLERIVRVVPRDER